MDVLAIDLSGVLYRLSTEL